ncbi:MAG: peptidoglycan recognition protein family protein [Phycisphaerales bacterium]|nr:peptidoglycan recognition protein family protein [Phycisphaerales bacterium]MCI0631842.1 peptidoglycan recognition protein family protein [Phycisphaerales bacterium]MCI0676656.1 peptidoglycan recognition protein family protein [Phycisphaerales bacterium]
MLISLGTLLAGCGEAAKTVTILPAPVWHPREMPVIDEPPSVFPAIGNVIPRTQWASAGPMTSLMNRMLPVQYITIHHDGMQPFHQTDLRSTAGRLELIRRSHRNKGWGDIGYHLAIDRQGRIWQGRSLSWQGAHVKDHNEGNIGIVALGNFDRQSPSALQVAALNRCVDRLMHHFDVPMNRVLTHQEWKGAVTACPGANLQRHMMAARKNHQIG